MYVEYWTPAQVRHPYPIVLVHGGGGQGLDWMGTPDGRPGWATYLVQEGYRVYVVDRPGHGRSPFHPELHGPFPAQANTYEQMGRQFTAPEKAAMPYGQQAKLHTQWPGAGTVGDPTADQVICGQGGSFLADLEATHTVWRQRLAELFDKTGPAMIMTHSMGGPSGWIAGDARPNLVKGIIGVEPAGPPGGNLKFGLTAIDIKYQNLKNIPIALVTSEASYHTPYDGDSVAYLKKAGCTVEHIKLAERGIRGNAHFMMMEKNSREVLQPILDWMEKNVNAHAKPARPTTKAKGDSTAMKLGGQGFFWVGGERKTMPYGTIMAGQTYVQYLIPAQVKHPTPVVLVHGGSGQMLHYMGAGDGWAGWAHYYVQEGYPVYLLDRPGHGRAPYHPDALGPINQQPVYAGIVADIKRADPEQRIADALIDPFMASQNATPRDNVMVRKMWERGAAELLDRIGPAIVQVHSAAGPYGWIAANIRPKLVKAIVNVEGGGVTGLTDVPVDPTKLAGIPIVYVTAEKSGRTQGPEVVAFLKQAGCDAEDFQLKAHGILGNGHFMMIENNRRQVFDAIRGWIEGRLRA